MRLGFTDIHDVIRSHVKLLERAALPPGFVPIAERRTSPPFAILEREIRSDEYLEYLNQPEVLQAIDAAETKRCFPRQGGQLNGGPLWPREPNGPFRLPDHWRPNWPVVGVSWEDARDYAEWRTREARAAGHDWTFRLPTRAQHVRAGGDFKWNYPFGHSFRPHWARSCFASRVANIGAVEQYPVDTSPYLVRDLAGGASEWLDDWYEEERGMRFLAGGAWGQGSFEKFKLYGGAGARPTATSGETGFRLVLEYGPSEGGGD